MTYFARSSCRAAFALLALAQISCVTQERQQVLAAREAHDTCVATHSKSYPECVALEQRMLAAQRRYEANARTAWACDPAQEQCPTPR